HSCVTCLFFFHGSDVFRPLHSFPTRRSSDLGLTDVQFLGEVQADRLPELLARASVFCLPSHWEGFPLSVLEAMASEAAVVATAVDRKSTRLNSSHLVISYAVFCLKKKTDDDVVPWRKLGAEYSVQRANRVDADHLDALPCGRAADKDYRQSVLPSREHAGASVFFA